MQEFHKEGSILIGQSMPLNWSKRKIKSNAHVYAIFRAIEEEVKETNDEVIKKLFIEVFKDREYIFQCLIENLRKVDEVEHQMTGGLKRKRSETDDESVSAGEQPEDLDAIIDGLLTKFENKDLVYVTKFFKVTASNGQPHLAVAHPRIRNKAGALSYRMNFNGLKLKADCASLTKLDSDAMSGRGNVGPTYCTLVPIKDLGTETKRRVLARFNMEKFDEIAEPGPSASQDFPFVQSQTGDTIKVCQVCRYTTRDKIELKEHMTKHYRCQTCLQYFVSEDELEHHLPRHEKEMCSECKKDIRKDEMKVHMKNHRELNTFGRRTLKRKTVKINCYSLWQSEERKRIVESKPELDSNEVSQELGRRWRETSTDCKNMWKAKAANWGEKLKQITNAPQIAVDEDENAVQNESEASDMENHAIDEVEDPAKFIKELIWHSLRQLDPK